MYSIKKSPIFYKFLLSYIIILSIPLIFLSTYTYSHYTEVLKDECVSNNIEHINKIRNVVDSQVLQLRNTSIQLSLNKKFTPFNLKKNPIIAMNIQKEIVNFTATNPFIYQLYLYFHNDDYIYSSTTSCNINYFDSYLYSFSNWSNKEMIYTLNNLKEFTYRPPDVSTVLQKLNLELCTFLYPLSADGINITGSIMILVQTEKFAEIINNSSTFNDNYTIILDKDNNLVFSTIKDKTENKEVLKQLDSLHGDKSTIRIDNRRYISSMTKSYDTNWTYISIVPYKTIMKKVNMLHSKVLLSVILIIIISILAIYFMLEKNYKPIYRLKLLSNNYMDDNNAELDELDSVQKTLEYLSLKNNELQDKLNTDNVPRKEIALYRLLRGEYAGDECTINEYNDIGINLNHPYYLTSIIYMKNVISDNILKKSIVNKCKDHLSTDTTCYVLEHIENNKLILLFTIDKQDYDIIRESLINLQKDLLNSYSLITSIGISDLYSSINQIPKSYLDASTAIDYRIIKGNNVLIEYNEIITKNPENYEYTHNQLKVLVNIIKGRNKAKLEEVLHNIVQYMKTNNIPIFIARGICYDMINKTKDVLNDTLIDTAKRSEIFPDIFTLIEFDTIENLVDALKIICLQIIDILDENASKSQDDLISTMHKYISDNFKDPSFSTDSMSSHFEMSSASLCQYYKKNTGNTITDTLIELRIEESKRLLRTTNDTLKKISEEVGYYNVSSFIRRFKFIEGITPGNYKQVYKETQPPV